MYEFSEIMLYGEIIIKLNMKLPIFDFFPTYEKGNYLI